MKRHILAGACAILTLPFSAPAFGAAQVPCAPDLVLPRATTIPVNLPAFGYTGPANQASTIALFAVEAGTPTTPVTLTVGAVEDGLVRLTPAPLTVGGTYQFQVNAGCSYSPFPEQAPKAFTIAPSAPIPTKLGALVGSPKVTVQDLGTSKLSVKATYALDPLMKPWTAAYLFALTVDGKVIGTKTTPSASGDTLDVDATGWCDEALAAKQNHDIVLHARLPFSPTLTTEVSAQTFSCPVPKFVTPSGTVSTPAPKEPPPNPAGTSTQNPSNPSNNGNNNGGGGSSGGCAIALARSGESSSFAALGVLGALGALVSRRRRQGGQ